ncbi:MAG: hypothetical protein MI685_07740 [Chlorobiales bacterium]|nr:hypothetical protein [Chlorobiales bacterium]
MTPLADRLYNTFNKKINFLLGKIKYALNNYRYSLIFITVFFSLLCFWLFLSRDDYVTVGGDIVDYGLVSYRYNSPQISGVSPLCGCYLEQEKSAYRGILFLAQDFSLYGLENNNEMSSYLLVPPMPSSITWLPTETIFRFKAKILRLKVNAGYFDIDKLYDQNTHNYEVIYEKELFSEQMIMLYTYNKINISLPSSVPLGCWIPEKDSDIIINYSESIYNKNDNMLTITEFYKEMDPLAGYVKMNNGVYENIKPYGYPMLDVLGPKIVLWTKDDMKIGYKDGVLTMPKKDKDDFSTYINVIMLEVPYSLRVSCLRFEKNIADYHIQQMGDSSRYAIPIEKRQEGAFEISIINPEMQNDMYEKVSKIIDSLDVVWRDNFIPKDYTYNDEDILIAKAGSFRYPPLPKSKGYHIYGDISELYIESAKGNLIIDSQPYDLTAPTQLLFKDIKSMIYDGPAITLPLNLNENKNNNQLTFQLQSKVFINNKSAKMRFDNYNNAVQYIIILSQILIFIITVVTFWKEYKFKE